MDVAIGAAFGCLAGVGVGVGLMKRKPTLANQQNANATPSIDFASPSKAMASPSNTKPIVDTTPVRPTDFSKVGLTGRITDISNLRMRTDLDSESFVELLRHLIGESKFLQNNPRLGQIPEEKRA